MDFGIFNSNAPILLRQMGHDLFSWIQGLWDTNRGVMTQNLHPSQQISCRDLPLCMNLRFIPPTQTKIGHDAHQLDSRSLETSWEGGPWGTVKITGCFCGYVRVSLLLALRWKIGRCECAGAAYFLSWYCNKSYLAIIRNEHIRCPSSPYFCPSSSCYCIS